MVDIRTDLRNNETRVAAVAVGTLQYALPKGANIVSGETYAVGTIPAGSVVTSVNLLVDKVYDGTTPTADIGIVGATTLYADDLALDTAGVTAGAGGTGVYYTEDTEIVVIPTISGATKGSVKVIVEYVQPNTRTGSYTA